MVESTLLKYVIWNNNIETNQNLVNLTYNIINYFLYAQRNHSKSYEFVMDCYILLTWNHLKSYEFEIDCYILLI